MLPNFKVAGFLFLTSEHRVDCNRFKDVCEDPAEKIGDFLELSLLAPFSL